MKFRPGQWVYYTKLGKSSLVKVVAREDYKGQMPFMFHMSEDFVFYVTRSGKYNYGMAYQLTAWDYGFEEALDELTKDNITKEKKKMAKFTRIGFIGVPKKNAEKRYFQVDQKVARIVVEMEDGSKITLKGKDYLNVMPPRQGKDQSDEEYAALKAWKKMELVHVTDSE